MPPLPRYRSHKEVEALKIRGIEPVDAAKQTGRITFEEPGYPPFDAPRSWHLKHEPQVGGYFVRYEDGYTSFSPAAAFEAGYTRI